MTEQGLKTENGNLWAIKNKHGYHHSGATRVSSLS
jgi:hypothetical protein